MYGFSVKGLLLLLKLLLRLHFSELRIDIRRWRRHGMLVAMHKMVQALQQGLMALLWRRGMMNRGSRIMRCHRRWRWWGVVVLVLAACHRAQSFQTMSRVRVFGLRIGCLCQLSRELAIASIPVRVEAQSMMCKAVVHYGSRISISVIILIRVVGSDESQFMRNWHPYTVACKSLLVSVEVL